MAISLDISLCDYWRADDAGRAVNTLLIAAAASCVALATVHSLIGERLIFGRMDSASFCEASGMAPRRWLALRGSWHLVSLFGLGFAAIFGVLAFGSPSNPENILAALAVTFFISGIFWFWMTKGGHPAWIVFLIVGGLSLLSMI